MPRLLRVYRVAALRKGERMGSSRIVLTLAVLVGTLAGMNAAAPGTEQPRLQVLESARLGEWINLKVRLVADTAAKVEFAPKDLFLEMIDGSHLGEWRWETFFPGASANLKKGDQITSIGTKVGDKILALSDVQLAAGSTATLTVSLAAGVAQEAVLFFQVTSRGKPARLRVGGLAPAEMK